MNQALTFILKLQDMLTPGMRQAANISNSAATQIQGQFERIGGSGKRMSASVDELRSRLDAINKVRFSTTVSREFDVATKAANRLEKQIATLENKGKSGGIASMLAGAAAGIGVMGLGKSALGAAAEREQQNISFGVMTGSQATGSKMVNDLVQMGAKTPYESADLIKNAQTLKAFGIENQKVIPILQTIGDIASGDAQKLSSLSLAFAQVSSAGKLSGQDLLQMVNAGFNPMQQMIKDGIFPSMAAARKAMESGAIGANMVEAAFKSATGPGGQFHLMMEKQSQTLSGRWSTFMDNAKMQLLKLGEALMPAASAVLTFGSAMLEGAPWAIALAAAIGLVTLSLTWASIQASLYGAITKSVTFFTNLFSIAQWKLNLAFLANPITWVIAGIIALIGVIAYVIAKTDGWGKQWDSIIKFFKFSWEAFKGHFHLIWLTVQDSFLTGIEFMMKAWYKLKSLWDEDGAAAGLKSISDQQSLRAAEIIKARNLQGENLKNAQGALKWELSWNDKSLGDITGDLKKKLGLGAAPGSSAAGAAAPGASGAANYAGMGLGGDAKAKSSDINGGGQRSIIININKVMDKVEQHFMGGSQQAADEFVGIIKDTINRQLQSLNGVR